MGEQELKDTLEKHRKWILGEPGGEQADLRDADLRGADLRSADLRGAFLSGADLSGADLSGADLSGADLSGAYLRGADLSGAYLSGAYLNGAYLSGTYLRGAYLSDLKKDFFKRLELAKNEVVGLYDHLVRGKIDGSCYEGECACFVGTVANIRKEDYQQLTNGLRPESSSPTEKWFLGIREGDTPQSNQIADITRTWIEEFAKDNEISLPQYKLVSSDEFSAAFSNGSNF